MKIFANIKNSILGIFEEIKKIHWPERRLVIYNAVVVIVAILISILIVAGIDFLLSKTVSWYITLR